MSITLPSAASIPSRTNGVAPYWVFFDASATTSSETSFPFHELDYLWGFNDASAGTWTTTGLTRNTATGPVAGHVFLLPGTYNWTLKVTAPSGAFETTGGSITVTDPDTVFSGTNTICISNSSSTADDVAGSTHVTTSSFATVMSNCGTNKRVLLHGGDTFTLSSGVTMAGNGPGILGRYGSGADPIVDCSGTSSPFITLRTDWRMMNLEIDTVDAVTDGSGNAPWCILWEDNNSNCLAAFLEIHGNSLACNMRTGTGATTVDLPCAFEVNGHDLVGGDSWGWLWGGTRYGIMGCRADTCQTHCYRLFFHDKGVFTHSQGSDPVGSDFLTVKFHQSVNSSSNPARKVVISDCHFSSIGNLANDWVISIGPQNDILDEQGEDIIVERCTIDSISEGLRINWSRITERNNIYITTRTGISSTHVSIEKYGPPPCAEVWSYNGTHYSGLTNGVNTLRMVAVGSGTTGVQVHNHGGAAPNWTTKSTVTGSPAGQSNNTWHASPAFVNAGAGDFHLQTSSPLKNAGVAVTGHFKDFDLGVITDTPDQGAFEFGAVPDGGEEEADLIVFGVTA